MGDVDIDHLTVDDILSALREREALERFSFGWFHGALVESYFVEAYVDDGEGGDDLLLFSGETLLEACRKAYRAAVR